MFNQDKQFRRPDGTLYDPSSGCEPNRPRPCRGH
jgi:hypothetical protein